jgi:hypothetical protein
VDIEEYAKAIGVLPSDLLPVHLIPGLTRAEAELVKAFREGKYGGVLQHVSTKIEPSQ